MFQYPYTQYHQLNLDYILQEVESLSELESTLTEYYTELKNEYTEIKNSIDIINSTIDSNYNELSNKINQLENDVENELVQLEQLLKLYVDSEINSESERITEDYTNLINDVNLKVERYYGVLSNLITTAITECKEYTDYIFEHGLGNLTVLNYFTGEYVTLQDMINYLSMFHVETDATYECITNEGKTYEEMGDFTYGFIVKYGLDKTSTVTYNEETGTLFLVLED